MKKQLTTKTVYQPNAGVKIIVTNKPVVDEMTGQIIYDADVTIKTRCVGMSQEVKFTSDEDIADFIARVDFDDPQQLLPIPLDTTNTLVYNGKVN